MLKNMIDLSSQKRFIKTDEKSCSYNWILATFGSMDTDQKHNFTHPPPFLPLLPSPTQT